MVDFIEDGNVFFILQTLSALTLSKPIFTHSYLPHFLLFTLFLIINQNTASKQFLFKTVKAI